MKPHGSMSLRTRPIDHQDSASVTDLHVNSASDNRLSFTFCSDHLTVEVTTWVTEGVVFSKNIFITQIYLYLPSCPSVMEIWKLSIWTVERHVYTGIKIYGFSVPGWHPVLLFQLLMEAVWLAAGLTMPLVVDAVWALWSIGAGIYDYFHTSAMEERIHTLENVLSIHQFVIAGLSAGLILLMTYILWRKRWLTCYLVAGNLRTVSTWPETVWVMWLLTRPSGCRNSPGTIGLMCFNALVMLNVCYTVNPF